MTKKGRAPADPMRQCEAWRNEWTIITTSRCAIHDAGVVASVKPCRELGGRNALDLQILELADPLRIEREATRIEHQACILFAEGVI
jgi:hypothetical protein